MAPAVPLTIPLPRPSTPPSIAASTVGVGPAIPAIDRIRLFSADQWEDFVLEWADALRTEYARVERHGGAGDMGCDVIAMVTDADGPWDNHQCKHYDHPLMPSDIWTELGKLVYYTYRGEFSAPRRYRFVAPQGAGTALSNLLKKPQELRERLLTNWDTHCRTKITKAEIGLDAALRAHIDAFDFAIFDAVQPLRIIEEHAGTRWHAARFGGGLPPRPPVLDPPERVSDEESRYVRELFRAYEDHLGQPIAAVEDLVHARDLHEHFGDARIEFYSAESLRMFSRDTLPPGAFQALQDDMHSGLRDDIRHPHPDGYARVLAVTKTARSLALAGHALSETASVRDRSGICHQLANNSKIEWIR